jgi:hypothetical protein
MIGKVIEKLLLLLFFCVCVQWIIRADSETIGGGKKKEEFAAKK